jgi:hypothetical protein
VVYVGTWRAVDAAGAVVAGSRLHGARTRPPFPLRLALELGVNTGGREAELAALGWAAFRPAGRAVRFTQQVDRQSRPGGRELLRGLKGKRARVALVLPAGGRSTPATRRSRSGPRAAACSPPPRATRRR